MIRLWDIFFAFCKIGTFTFGGGYAMLPIIQREIIEQKGWVDNETVVDYYAVGQCLPGVIAINTATFIGHKLRGKPGGVAASLGVAFPSLVIITVIAAFIQNFMEYEIVQKAFWGIRVVVCALIVQAIVKLWRSAVKDVFGVAVYVAVLALALVVGAPTVLLVAIALAAGILADNARRRAASGGEGGK